MNLPNKLILWRENWRDIMSKIVKKFSEKGRRQEIIKIGKIFLNYSWACYDLLFPESVCFPFFDISRPPACFVASYKVLQR